jgi:hypothetical protein
MEKMPIGDDTQRSTHIYKVQGLAIFRNLIINFGVYIKWHVKQLKYVRTLPPDPLQSLIQCIFSSQAKGLVRFMYFAQDMLT